MELLNMRRILYLVILLTISGISHQELPNEYYNLLPYDLIDDNIPIDEQTQDGYAALNFTNTEFEIPVRSLGLSEKTISSPFIIYAVFKLHSEEPNYSMFSIETKDYQIMTLSFLQASETTTRISLILNNVDEDLVFYAEDITNNWYNMSLLVEDNKAVLHLNCKITYAVEDISKSSVSFSSDSTLILGKSKILVGTSFPGSIQTLKIFNNADSSAVKNLCDGGSVYRDITVIDPDSEDEYDDLFPENLELNEKRGDGVDFGPRDIDELLAKSERGEPGKDGKPGEKGDRGDKGEKGQKGDAGIKGEPGESVTGPRGPIGPAGIIGPIGPPGKRGETGSCECSEKVVSTLLRTMPEMRGSPGEPGPKGEDGSPGAAGLTGQQGQQGERGPQGLKGETGERGDDGRPGRDGEHGQKGEPGKDGSPGPPGPKGEVGPPGPPGAAYVETEEEKKAKQVIIPGEKGDQGPIGPPGPEGKKGERGDIGPKGEPGLRGDKGDQGHKGAEGPRGEKGEQGKSGENGIPGTPGNHGNHGSKGEKGDRGDKGDEGKAGIPASLTQLLDEDMDPTQNALIVQKLRGDKGDRGERGETGIKGDQGIQGNKGEPGEKGAIGDTGPRGLQGDKGDIGPRGHTGHKGDRGEQGPPGQIPEEIISSIGANITRIPGPVGPRGPQGYKGQKGARGPTGPRGYKGDRGYTGPKGPTGPRGFNGTIGLKGEKGECITSDSGKLKGDKGDRGEAGQPGQPGVVGPPGQCSDSCRNTIIGPPGPPGPRGLPGISITGPKGEPGEAVMNQRMPDFSDDFNSIPGIDDEEYTTNTVIYKTRTALIKRTSTTRPGTLAYVLQEKILLLRVESGWQHVEMGPLFHPKREIQMPIEEPATTPSFTSRPYYVSSTADYEYDEDNRKYIRMVALNDPYSGKVVSRFKTGYVAANHECSQQSINYGGNFRAFLTYKGQNAISLVLGKDRHLPVRNINGELLFESWNHMFNGTGAKFDRPAVNIYSFTGRNVMIDRHWPKKYIWHGSDEYGIHSPTAFCDDWDSESPNDVGMASSLIDGMLLQQKQFSCDNKFIVLCVEISSVPRRKRHHLRRKHNRFLYESDRG